jgi:hypothetical protein
MSAYSLKLNVGDVTIEATATTQVNVEKLFEYALDRLAEIKKNLTLMNKYNLTLIFSLLRLILMTMSITNANKLLLRLTVNDRPIGTKLLQTVYYLGPFFICKRLKGYSTRVTLAFD